jgi:hypothetical protein
MGLRACGKFEVTALIASLFEFPATKLSKVYRGFRLDFVTGCPFL